ncbi:MAG: UDP-N-acetylmuramoyl-L-alanine--D-glutamate ligase [Eubacterium sp.]|nr:UDP-N-acetylmuramoyl-L-alanine--D-glutamate ligase [Eubacterium sp.]
MELENKKVLVVGLGKSGRAAYDLLKEMKARVSLYDGKKDMDVSGYDAPVYLGEIPKDELGSFACAVFSPGVPLDIPLANELREAGIPLIGEIELAYIMEKGVVAGITGTNGKTTTTTLVGEIMRAHNEKTFVVGNIGNPYTKEVGKTSSQSVTVAEISSFQLETIDTFRPMVSAILNITPDHLNRHKTMEEYIRVKLSITKNQTKEDLCVLNYEDEVLRENAVNLPCEVAFFSSRQKVEKGLYQNEKHDIVDAETGESLMNMSECNLPGDHNCENIMAAILITKKLGVPMDTILSVVKSFQAVEHRVEFVANVNGVDYYNDSKGTNPDAAIKGIQSMSRPTVLIGGGYDKGGEFDEWIDSFGGNVKKLLLLGATKEKIAETAKVHGFTEYEFSESLEEAVKRAAEIACDGDAVLLSPACASWDMFDSYEQRGTLFKEYVRNL